MDNAKPRYIHADDRSGKPNIYLNTDQIVSLTKNTVNDLTTYRITTVTNEHYVSTDLANINKLLFGDR